uniref:Helicase 2 n=1 Tax=Faxonius propinquus nudivirus TaxID=3139431 RepID=A0AAU8GC51_9VIRU
MEKLYEFTIDDILNFKILSFNDLILLSSKSYGCLYTLLLQSKQRNLLSNFLLDKTITEIHNTCTKNEVKLFLVYNSLNLEQKEVFVSIHKNLNNSNGSISCIDASPGTGKTFLVGALALTYNKPIKYLVYTNKLANQLALIHNLDTETCCKFLMSILNKNYYEVVHLWSLYKDNIQLTFVEKYKDIINLVLDINIFQIQEYSLYILDEDSVVSPWLIFFLFCLHKQYSIHLLFIGDRFQQNSINKTSYHNANNFELIQSMIDADKIYFLNKRIRQQEDVSFAELLNEVTKILKNAKTNNDLSMSFDIKYNLFKLFRNNFFINEDFNNMYISQYHRRLKERLLRYEKYLINTKISYDKAFISIKKNKIYEPINNNIQSKISKFLSYIYLVKNSEYIYKKDKNIHFPVIFLDFYDHLKSKLIVQKKDTNKVFLISRINISTFIHDEHLYLLKKYSKQQHLYQFPLCHKINTYHAIQGLTIYDKLELDFDTSSLNSFYVGITRILTKEQLGKISSKELCNFILTEFYNNDYYYKASSLDIKHNIKNIKFITTTNILLFNKKITTRSIRILKSFFQKNKTFQTSSVLCKIVKLLITKTDLLENDVIQTINNYSNTNK